MSDVLFDRQGPIGFLTINKDHKRNALNNHLLLEMTRYLMHAKNDSRIRVIILRAQGAHFSAGADLQWMQSMVDFSAEDNIQDALILGTFMYNVYHCPKPTLAMVQGCAFGGGAGLVAACSIAVAAHSARFCFPEVKLGLIPAVISPYVIKAIGERQAQMLFMSGEVFDARRALALHLIQHCVPEQQLLAFTVEYAGQIAHNAPEAVKQSLQLTRRIAHQPIDEALVHYTAALLAKKRISTEGQQGLNAFLKKQPPNWD